MKNEAEIIWWKTVKQDVETTPRRFTQEELGWVVHASPPSSGPGGGRGGEGEEEGSWTTRTFLNASPPPPPPPGNYNSSPYDRFMGLHLIS